MTYTFQAGVISLSEPLELNKFDREFAKVGNRLPSTLLLFPLPFPVDQVLANTHGFKTKLAAIMV